MRQVQVHLVTQKKGKLIIGVRELATLNFAEAGFKDGWYLQVSEYKSFTSILSKTKCYE